MSIWCRDTALLMHEWLAWSTWRVAGLTLLLTIKTVFFNATLHDPTRLPSSHRWCFIGPRSWRAAEPIKELTERPRAPVG